MTNQIDLQLASTAEHPDSMVLKKWAQECLEMHGEDSRELSLRIVDEEEITELNHQYCNKEKATNVLSFPSELDEELPEEVLAELELQPLGDIVICANIVNQEAEQQGKSDDAHWAHMVIHGCLHLLGYDHIKDDDANIMEDLEVRILDHLGFPNPY